MKNIKPGSLEHFGQIFAPLSTFIEVEEAEYIEVIPMQETGYSLLRRALDKRREDIIDEMDYRDGKTDVEFNYGPYAVTGMVKVRFDGDRMLIEYHDLRAIDENGTVYALHIDLGTYNRCYS